METFLIEYGTYLSEERRVSGNTLQSYLRDVRQFFEYVKENKPIFELCDIDNAYINSYLFFL